MVGGLWRSRGNHLRKGRSARFDDGADILRGHATLEHLLFEATRLNDSPDVLGRHASLEHIQLEFKVEPGQADLPCKDAQANAQDASQGDEWVYNLSPLFSASRGCPIVRSLQCRRKYSD